MIDVVPWLREERAELVALLRGLDAEDWHRRTECPEWTVKGVALHVLGDDLSLLARQRDDEPNGLISLAGRSEATDFRGLLNAFNEEWVTAAQFLSPQLVVELLRLSGDWTADWYERVNPERLGERVPWTGPAPAPYWLIAAREYVERWVHHLQVARALDRPGPGDAFTERAATVIASFFPRLFAELHAPDDASVGISVLSCRWTLLGPGGGWAMSEGRTADATVEVVVERAAAARAFSRGLSPDEMRAALSTSGDPKLGHAVVDLFVDAFARAD